MNKGLKCFSLILATTLLSTPSFAGPAPVPPLEATPTLESAPTTELVSDSSCDACDTKSPECRDRFEKVNRAVFKFNDVLDTMFLRPVATLYNKIMPRPLNRGIHNFFNNIYTVPTIANDLLQLNIYQAMNDTWRLGINTTIGIGGLFDVASCMGLEPYTNDFGLTLATWGWCNSEYVVIPFWGPNTFRDGLGMPVDYYAFSVWPRIHPPRKRYELYALSVIDARAQLLSMQSLLDEVAYDKYIFVRNAYMQRRAFQIEENKRRGCVDRYCPPCAEEKPCDTEACIEAG